MAFLLTKHRHVRQPPILLCRLTTNRPHFRRLYPRSRFRCEALHSHPPFPPKKRPLRTQSRRTACPRELTLLPREQRPCSRRQHPQGLPYVSVQARRTAVSAFLRAAYPNTPYPLSRDGMLSHRAENAWQAQRYPHTPPRSCRDIPLHERLNERSSCPGTNRSYPANTPRYHARIRIAPERCQTAAHCLRRAQPVRYRAARRVRLSPPHAQHRSPLSADPHSLPHTARASRSHRACRRVRAAR